MSKSILCLDFDGVCHSYTSGWQGVTNIPDPPVEGLFKFLIEANKYFSIHIYSSRSHQEGGIPAMMGWFMEHCTLATNIYKTSEVLEFCDGVAIILTLRFPTVKPPAMVTIDDRALTFTGVWPSIDSLRHFKPWNKQ